MDDFDIDNERRLGDGPESTRADMPKDRLGSTGQGEAAEWAMSHCFAKGIEPYLDRSGLREALGRILPRRPSFRTLERWANRGLPFGRDPLNGRRIFLLSAVVAWFQESVDFGSPAAGGRAAARELSLARGANTSVPRPPTQR